MPLMKAGNGGDSIRKKMYKPINISEEDEFDYYSDMGEYDEEEEKSRKKEKKRRKHIKWLRKSFNNDWDHPNRGQRKNLVPEKLKLVLGEDTGFFFGKVDGGYGYIGKPDTEDGNILTVGESGRGKTMSVVAPTMGTWGGIQIIIDVKGNLFGYWKKLNSQRGKRVMVFDPENPESSHYDPFIFLRHGGEKNLVGNARDLALALIPLPPSVTDPVWVQAAQNFLTGALIYYYEIGVSFHDAIIAINELSITDTIGKVMDEGSTFARAYMSQLSGVQEKVILNIGMEISSLAVFATDPMVLDALSVDRIHELLDWQEIFTAQEPTDVILVIPESRIEQWRPMVLLMINQLIKSLEQRKERTYHLESELPPVLILLDEFTRIGKISAIKSGLATLRSRGVTFALFIQSLADLNATYGKEDAISIIGNCPYKAILGVTDAECQNYFSRLAGSCDSVQKSVSMNHSGYSGEAAGYSRTMSEVRKPVIRPEEFLTMKDVVLFTPYGNYRVNKIMFYENEGMFLHCRK